MLDTQPLFVVSSPFHGLFSPFVKFGVWDFYQHVDVIRAHFCFYYFYSFPFTELSQNPSYLFSIFSVEQFAPIFRRKHNVVFAIPFRSFYKELHADHETGAADNK